MSAAPQHMCYVPIKTRSRPPGPQAYTRALSTRVQMAVAALAFVSVIVALVAYACAVIARAAWNQRPLSARRACAGLGAGPVTPRHRQVLPSSSSLSSSLSSSPPPPPPPPQPKRPALRVDVGSDEACAAPPSTGSTPTPLRSPSALRSQGVHVATAASADTRRPFRVLCRGCGRVFGDANMRKHFFCEFSEDERVAILSLARELAARGHFIH